MSRMRVLWAMVLTLCVAGAARAGLVSYWPFDEGSGGTVFNTVGGMPDGTLQSSMDASDWITGHTGNAGTDYALDFDGSDDYIAFGPSTALNNLNSPFSVQAWFSSTAQGDWFRCVIAKYGGQPSWGLGWQDDHRMGFYVRDGSGSRSQAIVYAPTATYPRWGLDDEWHYLVGVRGNGKVTFFGDGEVMATVADVTGSTVNTTVLRAASHNTSQFLAEVIDDVALWDNPLTPQQVMALYTGAYTPATLPSTLPQNYLEQTAPAIYWRLEETITGGGAGDWSGNDYHMNGSLGGITKAIARPVGYDANNRAMDFDGSSGYFATGAPVQPTDFAGGGDYSIELWFNADSLHQGTLVGVTASGTNNQLIILGTEADGSLYFLHRVPAGGSGGTELYSSKTYTADDWHHLVAVKDGATMLLYLDGALDPNSATDATTISDLMDVAVGRLGKGISSLYFDGLMDELVFYNRALTANEVLLHFNFGIPEPGTLSLLGLGALGLLARHRRRRGR